jgi:hypothetical protein
MEYGDRQFEVGQQFVRCGTVYESSCVRLDMVSFFGSDKSIPMFIAVLYDC